MDNRQWVREIPRARARKEWKDAKEKQEDLITLEEIKKAGVILKTGQVPGLDSTPDEILQMIVEVYPNMLQLVLLAKNFGSISDEFRTNISTLVWNLSVICLELVLFHPISIHTNILGPKSIRTCPKAV